MKDFIAKFSSPDTRYRGMPFWAWNAELDEDELVRQINFFHKMGLGGFFMHARVGLNTEYLGEKWFSCIRTCIQEAEKLGMHPFLYDEDRWPSGAAGSIVTRNDSFKMKELRCQTVNSGDSLSGNTLALFAAVIDPEKRFCSNYRRINAAGEVKNGETMLNIYWQNQPRSDWFNGESYLDTMNPEAVRAFIDSTHEKYRQQIGEKFGSAVPGIFTDEPCYLHFVEMALPWTPALPEKFAAKWQRDLIGILPELFFNIPEKVSLAKWQFFNTVTELFVNSYSRTIGQWCEKYNLKLTGHVLGEDSLTSQTAGVGAAMRFYEFMQIPGIDLLTEVWNVFTTTKQCTSAARQFGKTERLSELYGCTGWDFPLAGHKALGDWQYALGINLRCQHLAFYSMAGEAKRDYPASISYQSPWAEKYRYVEDYFARIGTALKGAEEIRDLLVIHPIESYWSQYLPFPEVIPEKRPAYDKAFESLTRELLSENLDFDYGDEEIISRIFSVKDNILHVGKAAYKAVLIPELLTIRSSTLELLKTFAISGGKVCYLGAIPQYVDAVNSEMAQQVYTEFFEAVTPQNFIDRLTPSARIFSMTTPDGKEARPLLSFFGKKDDFHVLFINNFGKEFSDEMLDEKRIHERNEALPHVNISLKMPFSGNVYEFNAVNGTIHQVDAVYLDEKYRFTTGFAPRESHLYIITENLPQNILHPVPLQPQNAVAQLPDCAWDIAIDEPNVLLLDHADIFVNGKKEFTNAFILPADALLRKRLNGNARGEAMLQPWLLKKLKRSEPETLDLRLEYAFRMDFIPGNILLALEEPEKCRISINGVPLKSCPGSWWVDRAIRTLEIPLDLLRKGVNRLAVEMPFSTESSGLENLFILGRFGVKDDVIIPLPETLDCGDWCTQGFPEYSGMITYSTDLPVLPENEKLFLQIPHWKGSLMEISVNDHTPQICAWPPEYIPLPDDLKRDGSDRLKIKVYSHRRNSFGPFYLKDKWVPWLGSKSFNRYETGGVKQLVECGLLSAPVIKSTSPTVCDRNS